MGQLEDHHGGCDKPTGVAFDSAGNLYVVNIGTESVTQYSSAGVQNTAGTITAAINTPEYIAMDGLDNIWVNDGNIEVNIYAANVYPANTGGPATYQNIFVPPGTAPIYGIALHNQYFAWGSGGGTRLRAHAKFVATWWIMAPESFRMLSEADSCQRPTKSFWQQSLRDLEDEWPILRFAFWRH